MFSRKQKKQLDEKIEKLERSIDSMNAVIDSLNQRSRQIFDMYSEALSGIDMSAVDRRYAEMTQSIICRVSAVETMLGRQNGDIHRHEQTFKALGADMIARASGGGSVAPITPATKSRK